jgi:HTH-type transcriptional regulator, sugar sensing transcriptional regulator
MTTQIDELIGVLRGIGFSKNEAAVYLACLELGPSAIWDIAKASGIKRPTCYVLLEELAIKGFASSTNDGKRTIYTVSSPKQLQQALERRQTRFVSSMSQLTALASNSPQKPVVRLYEGIDGVLEVYNLSLTQPKGSEILIYGTAAVELGYKEFIAEYLHSRVKRGIQVRAILPDNALNRQVQLRDAAELRQTRFLPENQYNQQTEMNIFADRIAYIAHSETEPFATVIESQTMVSEEQMRFNLLWNLAQV